jgi:hypothetical protein
MMQWDSQVNLQSSEGRLIAFAGGTSRPFAPLLIAPAYRGARRETHIRFCRDDKVLRCGIERAKLKPELLGSGFNCEAKQITSSACGA